MKNALVALLVTLASLAQAELISGKVIGVIDGDTIDILDDSKTTHRIRLSGIDAPEKKQPFGSQSKQTLSEKVFGRAVTIDTHKSDRYQRMVGKILLDGQDVNLQMIVIGNAWHYKAYEREQSKEDRSVYADAENTARQEKRGLWRDANPIAPWEFRRSHSSKP